MKGREPCILSACFVSHKRKPPAKEVPYTFIFRMALCAWSGYDALLAVLIGGATPQQAATQLHTILPAVVTKN